MPSAVESDRDDLFWKKHPGLVWSNPHTCDSIMIANALLKPNFHLLLDIAERFGLGRLEKEWHTVTSDPLIEERAIRRARPIVERCLRHMREGMQ